MKTSTSFGLDEEEYQGLLNQKMKQSMLLETPVISARMQKSRGSLQNTWKISICTAIWVIP